jgi:CheY-like chemotaxis protein
MSHPRVLLVDDEGPLRVTLAANLELEGFEVIEAASGEEALDLAERKPFDLVLTDIRMPGMSGVDLFRALRKRDVKAPVVLMTAFALEGLIQEALGEGAFTILPKPFEVAHVVRTLSRAAREPLVLVVDDTASVTTSTVEALRATGIRCEPASSGEEALRLVGERDIDVCVVDMVLPTMSGSDVVEQLRREHPEVTLIAVSGHQVPEMIRKVLSLGADTFLNKPFAFPELIRAIAHARGRATAP